MKRSIAVIILMAVILLMLSSIGFNPKDRNLRSYRKYTSEVVLESLTERLCSRIEREIPELIKRGYAEDVSAGDLYHVHVCLEQADIRRCSFNELLLPGFLDSYSLLYHSLERIQLLKAEWLRQLEQIGDPDINMWISQMEQDRFNYSNLMYSASKSSTPPNPLDWTQLHQFSILWCNWLSEHCPEKTLYYSRHRLQQRLVNKLIMLSGALHPHYYEAVEMLMRKRVCRTTESEGESAFFTEVQVVPDGLWYPITVYFVQKTAVTKAALVLDRAQVSGISCIYGTEVQKLLNFSPKQQRKHNSLLKLLRRKQPRVTGGHSENSLTGFEEVQGYPQRCILFYSGEAYLFALWSSCLDNAVR